MKIEVVLFLVITLIFTGTNCFSSLVSSIQVEEKSLKSIKEYLDDADNVLFDWNKDLHKDHCSWRGVECDNITVISLNLSSLNLGGKISPAIGNLKNLRKLNLRKNHLSGQIPDEIGNCLGLESLDLSWNALYGRIPNSIVKLKHLEGLKLAHNKLAGQIPKRIYSNGVLLYLDLSGNNLSGTLSPDMCNSTSLWYFDVSGNSISGTIPENIGNCTSFQILNVEHNQITGDIPYSIGLLQLVTLSLEGNRLTGKIPDSIGLMQGLVMLFLSENELVGPIPPIVSNLSTIERMYLNGNKLTGPIPPQLGKMSNLHYLMLNDNHLVGEIPAELGKLERLFGLNLGNNFLEGPIPENISSCKALNRINLFNNQLNGSIPSGFKNLGNLTYLNLSRNHFKGRIPSEVGRIINLDTLDLSSNNFSGPVPSSVGDLVHLLVLNLSKNHVDGPIPVELGKLSSFQILDMSFNNLSGKIPEELGQLQFINSLDLSNNNLSGPIPPFFSRFPAESFSGNPFLCGNLSRSCFGGYGEGSRGVSRSQVLLITCSCIALLLLVMIVITLSSQQSLFLKGCDKTLEGPPKIVCLHNDMASYSYEDILRITENFSEKYIIGDGASQKVYKCVKDDSKPIAIKRFNNQNPHNIKEFETELKTIGSIKHRNLVSLLGYSLSPNQNLLFYEYMTNGSLWDLLHGPRNKVKLDWDARLKIAVGAAEGLAYLHCNCSPSIIHRDIKSANILMDDNFEAHLTDFGTAKSMCVSSENTSTSIIGTFGYIDPEYVQTSRPTEMSDIYSFGIVLLELITGVKAVDNETSLRDLIMSKTRDKTIMETVDPVISSTFKNFAAVGELFQLARSCIKDKSSDRPTIHEVIGVLKSVVSAIEDENAPPQKMVTFNEDMASYTYDDIMNITENFNGTYIIGYGALSTVYKCMLKNSKPIIIKRFPAQPRLTSKEFETEREMISRIKHHNIVSLLGYAITPKENLLFYNYMPSLRDLLCKSGNESSDKPEPGNESSDKAEPGNQSYDKAEPGNVSSVKPEPGNITEPQNVPSEDNNPGNESSDKPEPGNQSYDKAEPGNVSSVKPEPGNITEPQNVPSEDINLGNESSDKPEPGNQSYDKAEPGNQSYNKAEPGNVSSMKPEPGNITEPQNVPSEDINLGNESSDKPEPGNQSYDKAEPGNQSYDKAEPGNVSSVKPEPGNITEPQNVPFEDNYPGNLPTEKTEPGNEVKLDWATRLRIAVGAAQGLAYLHHNQKIIHGDIKSSAIRIDDNFDAQLTDFEIAKSLSVSKEDASTSTIRDIEPEYAQTEKSDIYSFGIVLLELITGTEASDKGSASVLHDLIASKTAKGKVMETVDPDICKTCKDLAAVQYLFQLAQRCTRERPSDRPTMHDVIRNLESFVDFTEINHSPRILNILFKSHSP